MTIPCECRAVRLLTTLVLIVALGGCASNETREEHDPWEPLNRGLYTVNDTADQLVLKPVAQGYRWVTPDPLERGVTNFFSNLDDFLVIINDLLQFKLNQAISDTSRLLVNSTMGVLGLIDVATGLDLPKHEEDFGLTLGRWGVPPGPYMVLPLLGPSTVRDTVGLIPEFLLDPINWFEPTELRYGLIALRVIDTRANLLDASKVLEEAALDPYIFTRDAFLQRRRYLVYEGNPPEEFDLDEDELDFDGEDFEDPF